MREILDRLRVSRLRENMVGSELKVAVKTMSDQQLKDVYDKLMAVYDTKYLPRILKDDLKYCLYIIEKEMDSRK